MTDLGAAPAGEMAACGTLSVDPAAETLEPGVAGVVEASFTNYEATPVTGVSVSLTVPDGWKAEPVGAVAFDSVAAGAKVTASTGGSPRRWTPRTGRTS